MAEQFSFQCDHLRDQSGIREFLTFDDEKKRVIGYGMGVEYRVVNAILKGNINSISSDQIQFNLVVAFDKIKLGDFTLNRKEGWMSSSKSTGHDEPRDTCVATPLRSVMDLWRLLEPVQ